ncbi:exonuclease [Coniochaeta sp. 2T2.1]|nr:exonuclease [Coniochaeta sp. 2T2.1]
MASSGPQHQLWHLSRGIVFAKSENAVYPRLPPVAGYHSSPDLLSQQDDSSLLANTQLASPTNRQVAAADTRSVEPAVEDRAKSAPPAEDQASTTGAFETGQGVKGASPTDVVEGDTSGRPPHSPLDFRIPQPAFQEAKQAEPGTPESFWSYNLYRGPGGEEDSDGALASASSDSKVKVHYCKTLHTTERVLQQYFMGEKLLGFDLEWAPDATKTQSAKRNVSLVQIASQSRIALFHLALYPKSEELVAPSFRKIMEDPGVTKAGVCIKGDCTRLKNFLGVEARGIFELSHLYKLVKYSRTGEYGDINRRTVNLAAQVQDCLGLPMFKGMDVRASDWSQPLLLRQIEYSASDAYAAVQIYAVLNHQRQQLDPTPPLPYHAELNRPIRLPDGAVIPTADETTETDTEDPRAGGLALSPRYLKSLGASIKIEDDDGEPILKEATRPLSPPKMGLPLDPRVGAAVQWLAEYRGDTGKVVKAGNASLRAYHMWHHNPDLDPGAIAKLLRDPPLQTSTVVNYILEATRLEKLPYDAHRLQDEVLSLIPKEMRASRYRLLVSQCKQAIAAAASDKS